MARDRSPPPAGRNAQIARICAVSKARVSLLDLHGSSPATQDAADLVLSQTQHRKIGVSLSTQGKNSNPCYFSMKMSELHDRKRKLNHDARAAEVIKMGTIIVALDVALAVDCSEDSAGHAPLRGAFIYTRLKSFMLCCNQRLCDTQADDT